MKDSFVFYRSFKESLKELSKDDKLIMYEAISDYALDRQDPQLEGFPKALFSLIKPQLDANWKRFENGVKGGAPKGNKNALKTTKKQPKTTGKQPNVNVNDNVNVNEIPPIVPQRGKESSKFIVPTVEEIRTYCTERNNRIDPEEFYDFYQAKNWMIGKNKMKDWKASIRTWEKNKNNTKKEEHTGGDFYDEL